MYVLAYFYFIAYVLHTPQIMMRHLFFESHVLIFYERRQEILINIQRLTSYNIMTMQIIHFASSGG